MSRPFKCLEVPGFTFQNEEVRQPLAAVLFSNKKPSKVPKGLNFQKGQNCYNFPLTHRKGNNYSLQEMVNSDVFVFDAAVAFLILLGLSGNFYSTSSNMKLISFRLPGKHRVRAHISF